MNIWTKAVLATASAALLASPAIADHLKDGRKLDASLSGLAEVPNPGDPDGSGTFVSRINVGQQEICYNLTVIDIQDAFAAHIHVGSEGEPGPIAVTLATPDGDGIASDCTFVSMTTARDIIKNPSGYYVNVHNAEFPGGAVRGQLSK